MIAKTIIALLRERHSIDHVFVEELRGGSGYGGDSERRMDAWAMHHHPSKGNKRVAYEVKVSRRDFLKDIKDPLKHRPALIFSNEFFFVAPKGMIKAKELPLFAGLLEVEETGSDNPDYKHRLWPTIHAPWRDTVPPSWRFVVSLVRSVQKQERRK